MWFWQKWQKSNATKSSNMTLAKPELTAKCTVTPDINQNVDSFFIQQQIQLIMMDHESSELPDIIQQLQYYYSKQAEDLQLSIVYCYPFSHECVLYHAPEHYLGGAERQFLQQLLLRKSIQNDVQEILQNAIPDSDQWFSAKLIGKNHQRLIWRIYLTEQPKLSQYQLNHIDHCLSSGMQQWLKIYDRQQLILENERREFAAELHDTLAQVLGFLRLKSAQLHQTCKNNRTYHELEESSHELANYTHYAYQQTRDLITASRLIHQDLDFSNALKKIIDEFSKQSAIDFELDNRVTHINVSAKQSIQLIYIIRESLSNIVRHSQATHAKIYLEQQKQGLLIISIQDNGIGISLHHKRPDSFGLEIMQERAERIGAHLIISPHQPQGTSVMLQLNLPATKDNQHAT